jgi:SET domain-containing protein
VNAIKKGDFIMEYVGEVISNESCLQKLEELKDEINFYFLTLNGQECIDARKKGNFARFINHSCKPNSMTQKW